MSVDQQDELGAGAPSQDGAAQDGTLGSEGAASGQQAADVAPAPSEAVSTQPVRQGQEAVQAEPGFAEEEFIPTPVSIEPEAPAMPAVQPTAPPAQPYNAEVLADINNNKVFAVLSYLSLLCLVVLALKSKSRFAAYHARQGLIIMIIQLLSLYTISWGGSGLLLVGVTFGFSVIGVLEVLRGTYWDFPYLGKLAQKLTFL